VTFLTPGEMAIAAFRWLEYAGLVGFIGVVVVRRLAAQRPNLDWARPRMDIVLAVALVGGAGVVVVQAALASSSVAGFAALLTGSPSGWVRIGRVVAEGLAVGMCVRGIRLVTVPALLAVVLLPLGGHAYGLQLSAGRVLLDAVHVLSAGMWGGGLIVMAVLQPPGGWRENAGRALLGRFARVAPVAFAVTAFTGVVRASEELSGLSDLWMTAYGVMLGIKTIGVVAMLVLSWLAWRRGLPVARLEAAVVLAVLAATAVLAALPLTPGQVRQIVQLL
jgi:putative copper export protein